MIGDRLGWIMSVLLHGAVVTAFVVGLPSLSRPRPTPPPPVAVEFVKIADQTRVVEPEPEEETVQPQQSTPNVARAEPVVEDDATVAPLPKPDQPAPAAKPKPKPKPTISETQKLAKKVQPRRKPKPPSRIKSSRLAAVIDKSIKEDKTPTRKTEKTEQKPAKEDPFSGLRGQIATASLRDALSQKLTGCWNFPGGAKGIAEMSVTVRIWLAMDGHLSRSPEFIRPGDMNDGFYRTFAESARRAVVLCEPFDEALDYLATGRKYIDFNFNGAEFSGQ